MLKARDPKRPLPSTSKKTNSLFTNRINETDRFLGLLNAPEDSPMPLLMFYGVGGAGKTFLIQHLKEKCNELKIPWAEVDLVETPEADEALFKFAAHLKKWHGFRFKGFDLAAKELTAREANGVVTPKVVKNFLIANRFAGIGLEVAADIAGFGLIPKAANLIIQTTQVGFGERLLNKKGLYKMALKLGGEKALLELELKDTAELQDELLRLFADELSSSLPERDGKSGRGVLFFDQHEMLWRDGHGGAFLEDAWIRHLWEHLHERGVLMVVSGRDHLKWSENWPEEDDKERRKYLEEHLVGGLSPKDALEFLHRYDVENCPIDGIQMPQELQSAILRVTDEKVGAEGPSSHHCLLLALCAGIVKNTKEKTGSYPDHRLFNDIPKDQNASEQIIKRFQKSLHNQAMVLWLQELSLTPRFDEDYALSLDAHRRHNNGRAGWERLRQLSLLEEREAGFWEIHKLLRKSLQNKVAVDDVKTLHSWSAKYWDEKAAQGDWKRKGLSWYSYHKISPAEAILDFRAACYNAKRNAQAQNLRRLSEFLRELELTLEPKEITQVNDLLLYANVLQTLSTGNLIKNLHQAIGFYNAALSFLNKTNFPEVWARTQRNLGNAYNDLPTVNIAVRQEAIFCFTNALEVFKKADFPDEWAMTQNCLGNSWKNFPTGNMSENIEKSIGHHKAALQVFNKDQFPGGWAMTKNFLGDAYLTLQTGDRGENVRGAITCYQSALKIHTKTNFPDSWATIQYNLGNAYSELPTNNRVKDLDMAIGHYKASLQVYKTETFPDNWAKIQRGLGDAYVNLPGKTDANFRKAIDYYEAALEIHTKDYSPREWATIQNSLGNSYSKLLTGDRGGNLERAIEFYEKAKQVFTKHDFPNNWAIIQSNLADTYSEIPIGDRRENLRKAIEYYNDALEIFTEDSFPKLSNEIRQCLERCSSSAKFFT